MSSPSVPPPTGNPSETPLRPHDPEASSTHPSEPIPAVGSQRPAGFDNKGHVKRGAISALWVGIIAAAVVLILLIIFIAQNLSTAPIHYLGASGHMAVGLMLLLAAIGGVLLAAIPGTIRILQLRKALKRNVPKEQRVSPTQPPR